MSRSPNLTEDQREKQEEKEEEEREKKGILNPQLQEVLKFYECEDLLPYVDHLMWLSRVKETLGFLPFKVDYETICCLVILQEEINKKSAYDSQKMKEESERTQRSVKR